MKTKLGIKTILSRLNFALGNKPRISPYSQDAVNFFIPKPHRAVFLISCDFELAWAWRFAREINGDLQKAKEISLKERENMPFILELCETFKIPFTWATIGHLFLKKCLKTNKLAHENIPRVGHFENKYWQFKEGDWFDNDPCCNWESAREWYAPDLIETIINSRVGHELACHSFSHIDCSENNCPEDVLRKEIEEYRKAAQEWGINPKSFIFPGNLVGNLKVLKEERFTSYRIDSRILGFPQKDKYGLWQIPTTAIIAPFSYGWSTNQQIKMYKIIIERAIKNRRLCHFWFHPSTDRNFLGAVLPRLFEFIQEKQEDLSITTMGGYTKFLENAKL
jgi:peptidoglycan/xylan/chitin deacetylase (PgdA/CDA1 family)